MKIDKRFKLDATPIEVWEFITSPEKIGPCIPGCHDVEVIGRNKYRAAINIKAGPIKTTFHLTVTATEERPPEFARYTTQGEEGGKASRVSATSTLEVTSNDGASSDVHYSSEITIAGRLGKFASGVMKKMADKMGDEFVASLRAGIRSAAQA